MSSPATIPHTFINLSSSSPVEMTRPHYNFRQTRPRNTSTLEVVIIDSDTDDNGNYTLNNMNSSLHYGSQSYFGSNVTIPSTNTQSSPSTISLNNSRNRTGSDRNGGGPIRSPIRSVPNRASRSSSRRPTSNRTSPSRSTRSQNASERFSAILNLNLQVSYHHNGNSVNSSVRQHTSAFLPYSFSDMHTAEEMPSRHGSHENQFPLRNNLATTNLNSNDVQILSAPPALRKNNNNLSKDLTDHTRNIADNHTLICAKCNEVLQEKLWALGCGHVICGGCGTEFSGKKKVPCPSCQTKSRSSSMLQLYV